MSTADQNRRGFVEAWLRSFGGVIADEAEEMAERMEAAGYSSRRSLAGLFDETPQAIAKSFKVKPGVAYDLWSQAALMHGRREDASVERTAWAGFTKKLEDGAGAAALSVPSIDQCDIYLGHIKRYAKAREAAQTQHLTSFLANVYMEEGEFQGLLLKVDPWFNSQLGCILAEGLGDRLLRYMDDQLGLDAGGMEMVRALYAPHSMNVMPQRARDTKSVEHPLRIKHRCDLGCALVLWDAAKARNSNIPGWAVAEPNKMEGLLTMVSGLGLEEEIKIQRGVTRAMAATWTSDLLFDFLQLQALEWQGEGKQGKAHVAVGHSVYLAAGIEAGGSASQQQAPAAALAAESAAAQSGPA